MSSRRDDQSDPVGRFLAAAREGKIPELRPHIRGRVLAEFRNRSSAVLRRGRQDGLTRFELQLAVLASLPIFLGIGAVTLTEARGVIAIEDVYAAYMSMSPFGS